MRIYLYFKLITQNICRIEIGESKRFSCFIHNYLSKIRDSDFDYYCFINIRLDVFCVTRNFDILYYIRKRYTIEATDEVIKETINCKIRFIYDDWLRNSATRQMFSEFQSAFLY